MPAVVQHMIDHRPHMTRHTKDEVILAILVLAIAFLSYYI